MLTTSGGPRNSRREEFTMWTSEQAAGCAVLNAAIADVAEVWLLGSVIASWPLDVTGAALFQEPALCTFEGRVLDSGEVGCTIKAANDDGVPAAVLTTSLYERFSSRGHAEFAAKV